MPPEQVWPALADPTSWSRWCGAVRTARGRLDAGGQVDLVPSAPLVAGLHARTAPPMRVLAVEEERRIVLRQSQPGGHTTLTWTLDPLSQGCRLELDLTVTGPLVRAALAAFEEFIRGFGEDCARLARVVAPSDPRAHKVVIAGGAGSLGRALAADLVCRGHQVVLLSRGPRPGLPYRQVTWDGRTVSGWAEEFLVPERTSVVNLAGRRVDAWPTAQNIADLRESRVGPTLALVRASRSLPRPLAHWVQGSTTAIWSDTGELRITEDTPVPPVGLPQMTGVARPPELASQDARTEQLTLLRTAAVLNPYAPTLTVLTRLASAGLGGPVGGGGQWFSWIHVQDWLGVVRRTLGLDPPDLRAPVLVAAAPHPARNSELMALLRRSVGQRFAVSMPAAMVGLGARLLGSDPALALIGRHCTSRVLEEAGFEFAFPTLDAALGDLLT